MVRARFILILTATALCVGPAAAQFSVPWFTIDGGGGTATGGSFTLSGTIGQPDTRTISGGVFTINAGFWGGITAPTPCPGDLDGDGQVGQSDLGLLLSSYGLCPGQPGYVPAAGMLAGDPCVTQADLGLLLGNYGIMCP